MFQKQSFSLTAAIRALVGALVSPAVVVSIIDPVVVGARQLVSTAIRLCRETLSNDDYSEEEVEVRARRHQPARFAATHPALASLPRVATPLALSLVFLLSALSLSPP